MRSVFGDTLASVSHVGLGAIKCTPDTFLASYAALALLNLVAEPELPGLAAWMEDPFCCLQNPRDLRQTPHTGQVLDPWRQKARLRLIEDAALSTLPQAACVTSLPAFPVREDSRKGELACELQYCLGLTSVSTQVTEGQGWRTGVRRRPRANDHQQGPGKEDPVGLRLSLCGNMLA